MKLLPLALLVLLLPSVLSTARPSTKTQRSNAILATMTILKQSLPKSTASNTELPTISRQTCQRFTFRRLMGCLCEITRAQLASGTISREVGGPVIRQCASVLGVGRRRFGRICSRMGVDVTGDPRQSIIGLNGITSRCGPGAGLGNLGGTMI